MEKYLKNSFQFFINFDVLKITTPYIICMIVFFSIFYEREMIKVFFTFYFFVVEIYLV